MAKGGGRGRPFVHPTIRQSRSKMMMMVKPKICLPFVSRVHFFRRLLTEISAYCLLNTAPEWLDLYESSRHYVDDQNNQ